jgi:hypothetical protein
MIFFGKRVSTLGFKSKGKLSDHALTPPMLFCAYDWCVDAAGRAGAPDPVCLHDDRR